MQRDMSSAQPSEAAGESQSPPPVGPRPWLCPPKTGFWRERGAFPARPRGHTGQQQLSTSSPHSPQNLLEKSRSHRFPCLQDRIPPGSGPVLTGPCFISCYQLGLSECKKKGGGREEKKNGSCLPPTPLPAGHWSFPKHGSQSCP